MCRGGVHICRLKRTVVRFPLLFSVDLNFALYGYKYRILILFRLLNHPSRRPVLTRGAPSYPPGLAALSCALTSLRGLRFAWSPLRYRLASPPPRSEPRLLSARTLRGSALPALLSLLLCLSSCSLLLPDGLTPSEPRSVRADGIPGSERSAPTCHASAGRGSTPRRPGGGARRPPVGRAAERARSAARASSGHPPPHSALYPRAPPAWGWS